MDVEELSVVVILRERSERGIYCPFFVAGHE
jgi:hypothetical protein